MNDAGAKREKIGLKSYTKPKTDKHEPSKFVSQITVTCKYYYL